MKVIPFSFIQLLMCRFYSKSTLTYILSFSLLHYPMRWELSFSPFYRWRNGVSQRLSNLPQIIQVIRKGPKKSGSRVCSLHSHCKVKLKSPGAHVGMGACAEGLSLAEELLYEAESVSGTHRQDQDMAERPLVLWWTGAHPSGHSPHTLSWIMSPELYFPPSSSWFSSLSYCPGSSCIFLMYPN